MAKLTASKVMALAKAAGFPDSELDTAARVAYAESGWNPNAHNGTPPDDSYGLWQINMLGSMGPERRKAFGITSNSALYDPATNAKAAYIVWKGQGWKGWTTYTRGTYKSPNVQAAMGSATPASETGSIGEQAQGAVDGLKDLNPLNGVSASVNAAASSFLKGFVSTGGVIVGVVVLILGFVLIMRNQIPTGRVINMVRKAGGR